MHNIVSIHDAAAIIRGGGVVVVPTDTSYGLAADWKNPDAMMRVYAIKGRPTTKFTHVIVSDVSMAEQYVVMNHVERQLCSQFLPGPVTFIFQSKNGAPEGLGIRIPRLHTTVELVRLVGIPLTATSANLSGEPDLYDPHDIHVIYEKRTKAGFDVPDAILDGGKLSIVRPSTMISLLHGEPELVREGPIAYHEIDAAFQQIKRKGADHEKSSTN